MSSTEKNKLTEDPSLAPYKLNSHAVNKRSAVDRGCI